VLSAYLDDSGTHGNSPICVLAGYFGGQRQWVSFDRQWSKALSDFGIKEFHAHRFWAAAKGKKVAAYEGWDGHRATRLINRLLTIVGSHRVYPFGSAIVMDDWNALPGDEQKVLTGAAYFKGKTVTPGARKKAFFLPFVHAVRKAANYCPQEQKMDFVFDENELYKPYAQDYFELMTKLPDPVGKVLGQISFVSSEQTPAVQAADLLAYEINKYMLDRIRLNANALDPGPVLKRAMVKVKSRNHDMILWDKRSLGIALARFRAQKVTY
jgi:hypothetical protein